MTLGLGLILTTFLKLLALLRVSEEFGIFVNLVGRVAKDMVVFTMFYFLFIAMNAFMFQIVNVKFDTEGENYPNVSHNMIMGLQTFRNSIGDIEVPTYETTSIYHVGMIWFIWFMNIFVNCIVMLNFLVAVVSDSYANVMDNRALVV